MIQDIEPVCIAEQNFCLQFFHLPAVDDHQQQQMGESPSEDQVDVTHGIMSCYS